jgi:hypothetical protein
MERSTFDWNRWSTFVFDGLVHPQSWIPYVQMGFRMHLYNGSLFSSESLDFVRRYSSSSLFTMRSEGHCRLSLRLTCSGLLNSVTWLFSCRIRRLRYVVEYFFIFSVTNGIWRSLFNVRFETYHRALVMERSTFDWNRWSTFVFNGWVHPQSSIPYFQIGFRIHLYNRTCFPVKVSIFVPGDMAFVVLLGLGVGALSWCVSAKLAFGLGRDPDIWLLSVLVFVYCWLWQVGSSCVLLWKLSGKILSGLFRVEDQVGIGVVGMLMPVHSLLLGERYHLRNLLL